jgi:hypothetical protein
MTSMEDLKTPEVRTRFETGPAGFVTIAPRGLPNMGRNLGIWFVYTIFVSVIVAYVAGRGMPPGAEYMRVFALASTVAWAAYGLAAVSESVWFHRPWGSTLKQLFDAVLYGLVTGGAMAGLWP